MKLIASMLLALTTFLVGCAGQEVVPYNKEEITQLESKQDKVDALLTNAWAGVSAASTTISEMWQAGALTRDEAVTWTSRIGDVVEDLDKAEKLRENLDFDGAITKAEVADKAIEFIIKELAKMKVAE